MHAGRGRSAAPGLSSAARWFDQPQDAVRIVELMTAGGSLVKPMVALMFVDLNGFKDVNGTHGHIVGDHLLRSGWPVPCGATTPSRAWGDKLVVLLESITERPHAI